MRPYSDKKNVQKKAYYSDRFFKAPQLPREKVSSDPVFAEDYKALSAKFTPKEAYIERGQMVLIIDPADLKALMRFLKENLSYDFLSEMSAVDFLADRGGFEIFYQMLSMKKRKRLRVKYFIKEGIAAESICDIFKSADWAEREMYDMFGIKVNTKRRSGMRSIPFSEKSTERWWDPKTEIPGLWTKKIPKTSYVSDTKCLTVRNRRRSRSKSLSNFRRRVA